MEQQVTPAKTYFLIYILLLLLLAGTVGAAFLDLGGFNTIIALGIAVTKAILVILFFMNVRRSTQATRMFVGAGFLWLAILVFLTWVDYFTRMPGFSTWPK